MTKWVVRQKFDDCCLYRIMPFEQLMQMLVEKVNTLVKPSKWEDPYELFIKNCKVRFCSDDKIIEGKSLKWERWYGQCWTKVKDSDGLWRSFTHNKAVRCVKIRTTKQKLYNSLQNSVAIKKKPIIPFLSEVNYVGSFKGDAIQNIFDHSMKEYVGRLFLNKESDVEKIISASLSYSLLQTKRDSFQYEDEVRLFAYDENQIIDKDVFSYNISPKKLIEEIEFDPWTPDYLQNTYKKLLERYKFKNHKGKENVVKFSQLYKKPREGLELKIDNYELVIEK